MSLLKKATAPLSILFLVLLVCAACSGAPAAGALPLTNSPLMLAASQVGEKTRTPALEEGRLGEGGTLSPPTSAVEASLQAGDESITPALTLVPPAPNLAPGRTPTAATTASARFTGEAALTNVPQAESPCPNGLCMIVDTLFLQAPIPPPGKQFPDSTYRFGSSQGGERDVHRGADIPNALGTPVIAAADGEVIVAGNDSQVFYGPPSPFYGNLVILRHALPEDILEQFPDLIGPVYTLYGHLSQVSVQQGDRIVAGQEIGAVGMSGVAQGIHLHFEVRLGENSYDAVRNPELWLVPGLDEQGKRRGALAGRILDKLGRNLSAPEVVLRRLTAPDGEALGQVYLGSYEDKRLIGRPPFGESFAVSNLEAGWYEVSFALAGLHKQILRVLPGRVTVAIFSLDIP